MCPKYKEKTQYITYSHAEADRKWVRRKSKKNKLVSIFWCRYCQHWHIGHDNRLGAKELGSK